MTRFLVIGEGFFAKKVAEVIFTNESAILSAISTNETKSTFYSWAEENNIPIVNLDSLNNQIDLIPKSDWLISVNSPTIISPKVLALFPKKALNLHNGPLPEYAGLHVHQWGIRSGETEFGATVHFMNSKVDSGEIVEKCVFPIDQLDTGLTIFRRSFHLGTDLLIDIINKILSGETLQRKSQDLSRRHLYRHADALDGRIDWNWSKRKIIDFIRAGNYHPLKSPTYTAFFDSASFGRIEILRAEQAGPTGNSPGVLEVLDGDYPFVSCSDGSVKLIYARHQSGVMNKKDWKKLSISFGDQRLPGR